MENAKRCADTTGRNVIRIDHYGIYGHPSLKSIVAAYANVAEAMKEQTVDLDLFMCDDTFWSFAEVIRAKHSAMHTALTKEHPYILSMRVTVDDTLPKGMWRMTPITPNNRPPE